MNTYTIQFCWLWDYRDKDRVGARAYLPLLTKVSDFECSTSSPCCWWLISCCMRLSQLRCLVLYSQQRLAVAEACIALSLSLNRTSFLYVEENDRHTFFFRRLYFLDFPIYNEFKWKKGPILWDTTAILTQKRFIAVVGKNTTFSLTLNSQKRIIRTKKWQKEEQELFVWWRRTEISNDFFILQLASDSHHFKVPRAQ